MNRFEYVVAAALAPHQATLVDLAYNFYAAVNEVVAEGQDPVLDPAVLVIGTYIAFHTHADVNTNHGYQKLMKLCNDRAETKQVMQ